MIQVLERAFLVLDLLHPEERSLAELTRATGLQKTTLHNILKTLTQIGAVCRTDTGRYALGPKIAGLAARGSRYNALQPIAQQAAERLAAQIDETVVVSVLHRADRYVLAYAPGRQSLTVHIAAYEKQSPYSVCTGRVLLAYLPTDGLDEVVQERGFPGQEWDGIQDRDALTAALAHIRAHGIAFARSDDDQVQTLAVPILGPKETCRAAIGVHLPASRFIDAHRDAIVAALQMSATDIATALGVAEGVFGGK